MPFFTIIIPTFNSSKRLSACLNSIINQTFLDFEVVIIDAISGDTTVEVAMSFNDSRIKIFSEKDKGIYDAMNKGIGKASGSYLYFLGSDDTLYNQNVMQQIAQIISDENGAVIYGNVKMNAASKLTKDGTIYGGEFDLKRLISHNIPHQGIFYPKSLFEKAGNFNIKYKVLADHDFNLRAFARSGFKYVDLIVANFTLGGTSSLQKDDAFEKDRIKNFITYYLNKIHSKKFIPLRLYVQQAAFTKGLEINIFIRLYLMLIYSKLKIQSLYV